MSTSSTSGHLQVVVCQCCKLADEHRSPKVRDISERFIKGNNVPIARVNPDANES